MYACLKGTISQEKTWSTSIVVPNFSVMARLIRLRARRGDSVPEHIVATRSFRPLICSASDLTSDRREMMSRKMSGRRDMGGKEESSGETYFSFFPVTPPSSSSSSSSSMSMSIRRSYATSSVEAPSVSSSVGPDVDLLKNEDNFFCFILSLKVDMTRDGDGVFERKVGQGQRDCQRDLGINARADT